MGTLQSTCWLTIGARGTCFCAFKCHWCQQSSFINPIQCPCVECSNARFKANQVESIVALHMEKVYELPAHLMRMIAGYAYWNNAASEVRLHHILCFPLAEGSSFRLFTHYYNGPHGNISRTVDIIDHVASFIVGDYQDCVIARSLGIVHPKLLYY